MDEIIIKFLQKQTCASVCCVDRSGMPYCFSCFFAFDKGEKLLYFKTSVVSQHAMLMKLNPSIAGTVLPDKLNKLFVKGIQFEGVALQVEEVISETAAACYYKCYPIAVAMPGEIMGIRINNIKMTDNTMGFGKKISWNRVDQQHMLPVS